MAEILHREFVYLWYYFTLQLGQIFPYWVLGMVLGSASRSLQKAPFMPCLDACRQSGSARWG